MLSNHMFVTIKPRYHTEIITLMVQHCSTIAYS